MDRMRLKIVEAFHNPDSWNRLNLGLAGESIGGYFTKG
jgi:hypothetical protein